MQETERSETIVTSTSDTKKDCSLGTTKKGIGPTYSSKANRNGVRISVNKAFFGPQILSLEHIYTVGH